MTDPTPPTPREQIAEALTDEVVTPIFVKGQPLLTTVAECRAHLLRHLDPVAAHWEAERTRLEAVAVELEEDRDESHRQLDRAEARLATVEGALRHVESWLSSFSMPPTSTIAEKDEQLALIRAALASAPKATVVGPAEPPKEPT